MKVLHFNVTILIRCFFHSLCFLRCIFKTLLLSLPHSFCDCMSSCRKSVLPWGKGHGSYSSLILRSVSCSNCQRVGQSGGEPLVFLCISSSSCCPLQSLAFVLPLFSFLFVSVFPLTSLLCRTHKFRRVSVTAKNY